MNHKNITLFRIRLLFIGIFAFALVLVFRLYMVQVVYSESLKIKADKQYFREQPDVFNRGAIYFQNKDGSLLPAAVQKIGFAISINPDSISDFDKLYKDLSKVLELDKEEFIEKMEKGGTYQLIADRVDLEKAEVLKKSNLKGVEVARQKWRFYPANNLGAHILGIVAYNEDERAGRYGLEKYYEDTLKRNNEATFVNFFAEVFANITGSISSGNKFPKEGDVVTTIEPQVQAFLEKELENVNKEWNSRYSGGIVIDPKTGEIKAMAVSPSFNPNNFQEVDLSSLSNPLVEDVYEMGSIVKALTMASGIDSGAVTPETTYFDAGKLTIDGWTFSNFDGIGRGNVDMQTVLNDSLNTGVAFVVNQMGNKKFAEYMFNFGLDQGSGVDLPYEAFNLTENLKSNRDLEYATASFGQGIALTPISIVRALSTLANGGILITPHIVEKVDFSNGLSKKTTYEGQEKRVLKEETAEEISRMLVEVTDEALLNGSVKMDNYSIAAKTGTAQIAKEDSRGYYEDRFLHTFFGYFPAFDSKFLVFLFTYDPNAKYASASLTYPFMNITKYLINYYHIPPDR